MTLSRREFLTFVAGGAGSVAITVTLGAQQPSPDAGANMAVMDAQVYRPVRLPPKPGVKPQLTSLQRDDLEHSLHCQCGCTRDIYTCRTTDFSCSVSPAMHLDVMGLVDGGYGADEIIAAFRKVYGERVLMAPVKEGFNWAGYVMPFVALGSGAVVVATLIRRWASAAAAVPSGSAAGSPVVVDATPAELARLEDAVRRGG